VRVRMTPEQIEEKYADAKEGLLIRTDNLGTGEKGAAYLGPDGDYVILVGPNYTCATTEYPGTGTTQLTVKRA
jgi:hypothetical protein